MVTSIKEMARAGGAEEVTLSGWNGEDITVKLRRPSLYAMAAAGKIPNPLLGVADGLFMMNATTITKARFDETAKMMELIAREALVEPTLDEITAAGLTLTDSQYLEIYSYVIRGAKNLERFRHLQRDQAGANDKDDGVQGLGDTGDK